MRAAWLPERLSFFVACPFKDPLLFRHLSKQPRRVGGGWGRLIFAQFAAKQNQMRHGKMYFSAPRTSICAQNESIYVPASAL